MNLYGWDLLYASRLATINEKFKNNNAALASSFSFTSTDPVFGVSTVVSGSFGTWSLSAQESNKLILLSLPVSKLSISGLPNNNVENASLTVVIQVNLTFVGGKTEEQKNLIFDFNDDGHASSSTKVAVHSVLDSTGQLNETQKSYAGIAIVDCLLHNHDKLNYIFASLILDPSQSTWLTPENVAFDLVTTGAKDSYFCIFGTNGPKTGKQGQVDPQLFDAGDDMFLGIGASLFLKNVLLPGVKSAMKGATVKFTEPSITVSNYHLAGVKSGAITYYPIITHMTYEIDGDKLKTVTHGTCDLKADITMSFTSTSNNTINVDTTTRMISLVKDPNPVFKHNEDLGFWKWLPFIPVGAIATMIAAIVVTAIGNSIADSLKHGADVEGVKITSPNLDWSNINFGSISSGGISDNFFLRGKSS